MSGSLPAAGAAGHGFLMLSYLTYIHTSMFYVLWYILHTHTVRHRVTVPVLSYGAEMTTAADSGVSTVSAYGTEHQ